MFTSLYGHNISYWLLTASSKPSLLRIKLLKIVSQDDSISFTTPVNDYSNWV